MDHFADSFSEEQYCHSLYFHEQNRVIFQEYKMELHGANLKGLKLNWDVELPHQTDGSAIVLWGHSWESVRAREMLFLMLGMPHEGVLQTGN